MPLPIDIDGDGKDELLVGYKLLDSDGQMLWSYPISEDHTDEIVAGKWMPGEDEGHFACVSKHKLLHRRFLWQYRGTRYDR
ncbi:MAG: hypothetical protein V8S98_01645 [Lachnospiraceae bacterium]